LTLLTLLFTATLAVVSPVFAKADRIALVVGNSAYQHMPVLANPGADAKAVAEVLSKLGFDDGRVEPLLDLDLRALLQAVRSFGERARDAKVAVVYFSGHGLQLAQGDGTESYLLPVDADLADARDVPHQTLALHELLGEAARTQGGVVVLLYACRDNPTATRMAGMASRGAARSGLIPIAQSSLPLGVLVSYATSGGDSADDGSGRHSPYASALIRYLPTPERDVGQMLRRVRADVLQNTNGKQRPEIIDNLNGDVFLAPSLDATKPAPSPEATKPAPSPEATRPAPSPEATRPTLPSGPDDLAAETALWNAVRDSNRPDDLAAYLQRFPQGIYADLARNRLATLAQPASAQSASLPISHPHANSGELDTGTGPRPPLLQAPVRPLSPADRSPAEPEPAEPGTSAASGKETPPSITRPPVVASASTRPAVSKPPGASVLSEIDRLSRSGVESAYRGDCTDAHHRGAEIADLVNKNHINIALTVDKHTPYELAVQGKMTELLAATMTHCH
jgi:hypothetical protein